MLHAIWMLAAEEAEPSKVPFYLAGGALAAWAVLLSFIGLTRPEFPTDERGSKGVMAISVLLVLAAVSSAVLTG